MKKKNKTEIVLFHCGLRTSQYGSGSFFNTLLNGLKTARGIEVRIICTDSQRVKEISHSCIANINYLEIPQPENKVFLHGERSIVQKTYARRILEIAYPYFEDFSEPIFIFNSIDYLNLAYSIKELLDSHKIIYVHHSWTWKDFYNKPDEIFTKEWHNNMSSIQKDAAVYTSLQINLAKLSDQVITVTRQARNLFHEIFAVDSTKIHCIYNGIDFLNQENSMTEPMTLSPYIKSPERIILFSGRITSAKGIGELIEGFKIAFNDIPEYRLVMIGAGDVSEFVNRTHPISTKITFTGKLSKVEVLNWYRIAEIGVLPSYHEQCSYTALEMSSFEIPLIVSSVDGLAEMYTHLKNCVKLPVTLDSHGFKYIDPNSIAEMLIFLARNPEKAKKLGKNAAHLVRSKFQAATMTRKYVRLLKSLKISRNVTPQIIHYISLGDHVPEIAAFCIDSWRQLETLGFEIVKWDNESVSLFLSEHYCDYYDLFASARNYAEASDIARYLILFHFGGYYFDWDIELQSTELFNDIHLINRYGIFLMDTLNQTVSCEFFGTPKGLPVLKTIVERIKKSTLDMSHQHLTTPYFSGPFLLRQVYQEGLFDQCMIVKVTDVFQYDYSEARSKPKKTNIRALVHHWIHSWVQGNT